MRFATVLEEGEVKQSSYFHLNPPPQPSQKLEDLARKRWNCLIEVNQQKSDAGLKSDCKRGGFRAFANPIGDWGTRGVSWSVGGAPSKRSYALLECLREVRFCGRQSNPDSAQIFQSEEKLPDR